MIDILSALVGQPGSNENLQEARLSQKPTIVICFTREGEAAQIMHYEEDPDVRGYVFCPGPGCPYCAMDERPQRFSFLPVYSVSAGKVVVLRISEARGPGSLAAQLGVFLRRTDLVDVAASITRDGATYALKVLPLHEDADRGEAAVQQYLDEKPSLRSPFRTMTIEEIQEIPRVRRTRSVVALSKPASPSSTNKPGA